MIRTQTRNDAEKGKRMRGAGVTGYTAQRTSHSGLSGLTGSWS